MIGSMEHSFNSGLEHSCRKAEKSNEWSLMLQFWEIWLHQKRLSKSRGFHKRKVTKSCHYNLREVFKAFGKIQLTVAKVLNYCYFDNLTKAIDKHCKMGV